MQKKIAKSAMQNGLIMGGLLSLKFLFSTQKNELLLFLSLALSALIIVVLYTTAIRFRKNECDGAIQYGQAFSYIFKIYIYGSIIASLVILIYTKFIDPAFLETLLNQSLIFSKKLSELLNIKTDESAINITTAFYKPASFALVNIFMSIIAGAFWGVILAAFVKKDKDIFSQQ